MRGIGSRSHATLLPFCWAAFACGENLEGSTSVAVSLQAPLEDTLAADDEFSRGVFAWSEDPQAAVEAFNRSLAADEGHVHARAKKATALYDRGSFEEAEAELELAVKTDSSHSEIWQTLFLARFEQGDREGAEEALMRAIETDRTETANWLWRGRIGVAQTPADAVVWTNAYIERDPEDHLAYFLRGNALVADGQARHGLREYTAAVGLAPDFGPAHFNVAVLYLRVDEYGEAIAPARRAAKAMPQIGDAHRTLGWCHQQLGDAAAANEAYLDGMRATHRAAQSCANFGLLQAVQGNAAEANQALTAAARLDETWRTTAWTDSFLPFEQVRDGYLETLRDDPENTAVRFLLANLLWVGGQRERAGEELAAALEIDGDFHLARARLAEFRGGRSDEDLAVFERLVEESPEIPFFHVRLGYHLYVRDLDAAVERYRRAVELDPENAVFREYLGRALIDLERFDDAVAELSLALRVDPYSGQAYYYRARSRRVQEDFDGAILDASRAIWLEPGRQDYHFERGLSWKDKGDGANAIRDFAAVVDLDSSTSMFDKAYAELDALGAIAVCGECGGAGWVQCSLCFGLGRLTGTNNPCPTNQTCANCGERGWIIRMP